MKLSCSKSLATYLVWLLLSVSLQAQTWNYQLYLSTPTNEQGDVLVQKNPQQYIQSISAGQHSIAVGVPAQYYDDCVGLGGTDLRQALHRIMQRDALALDYTPDVWTMCRAADESPDEPNSVWLIYKEVSLNKDLQDRGTGASGVWNREHVWAKSHGDFGTVPGPGTDGHHLRAADRDENERRSYLNFSNVAGPRTKTTVYYEPPKSAKGDVARMILYMDLRWEGGDGFPDLVAIAGSGAGNNAPEHGDLRALLQWHEEDPVDPFEIRRNNIIYQYQKNRNPFVDHPELVHLLYGQDQKLSWDGGVNASHAPALRLLGSLRDFGTVLLGNESAMQSYRLSASNLAGPLHISASTHFLISLSETANSFAKELTILPNGGEISERPIYVKFVPETSIEGPVSGVLLHQSEELSRSLSVGGTEGDATKMWNHLYTNDFETQCGQGWQYVSLASASDWHCSPGKGAEASNAVYIDHSAATVASHDWLISPSFDLARFERVQLQFWVSTQGTGSELELLYSFNYRGNTRPLEAQWFSLGKVPLTNNPSNVLFDMGVQLGNNCHFALVHRSAAGAGQQIAIDDFRLSTQGLHVPAPQRIYFEPVEDKQHDAPPFELRAYASSGLAVGFELLAGPASLSGATLRLDGSPGVVRVRAVQPGNAQFDAAPSVEHEFEVLRPLNAALASSKAIQLQYDAQSGHVLWSPQAVVFDYLLLHTAEGKQLNRLKIEQQGHVSLPSISPGIYFVSLHSKQQVVEGSILVGQ